MDTLLLEDIKYVAHLDLPWEKMKGSSILITGASGLVGSFLVDVIMQKNSEEDFDCKVYALGRNAQHAKERFANYFNRKEFSFISHDMNEPLQVNDLGKVDFVLHLASNTHPVAYSTDPIGTITTNIIGTNNLLQFAVEHGAKRFAFASSNEIYGENRGDVEFFDEKYCGYIDSNTLRAGYPESKRCGEALCQSYKRQMGLDVVVMRLTRTYGPTMLLSDTKAISQFIRKGVAGEDIILKSAGTQFYSYTYVADAVAGLLTVLLKGESGEVYNIADAPGDMMLKDLAATIANIAGKRVRFELPDEVEKAGYSTATKARLDGTKIKNLGWTMQYDMQNGLARTIEILKRSLY